MHLNGVTVYGMTLSVALLQCSFVDEMRLFVLFALCAYVLGEERPSRLVTTAQGPVRGYKDPDYDVFVFYSIPYATAPTGRNRYKGPQPPPVWQAPFEAVSEEIICPQIGLMQDTVKIREDCLIANIYVPDTDDKPLPVVVYVHGGAYLSGYGDMINPRGVVNTKKVMVVTFNYRLAAHGFLCLGTKNVPGNAGIKDQVAMLRWVQKNIASFGGNPKDVTIVGSSAGSSSVDLLMISKMAKGLFNKVIPESGANTAAFSVQQDPLKSAKEYAKLVDANIDIDDLYELEEFFINTSLDKLHNVPVFYKNDSTFLLSPCVERETGEEVFLDDSPVNILKRGDYEKLPMLYGFANMEGLIRLSLIGEAIQSDLENMNMNFTNYLPADLHFDNEEDRNTVAEKIKGHFFGTKIDEEDILDYVDYFSDVYFTYSTLRSIKLQVEAGNDRIYLYEYSFTEEDNPNNNVPFTKVRGANHCAQTTAVWGSRSDSFNDSKSEAYKNVQETVRNIWVNFISTGNPTPEGSGLPEWPPVGRKWSPHMSIGKALELRGSLLKERTLFWEEIYAKHYLSPQPPPLPPA